MKFITVYIKPSLIFNKLSNASALQSQLRQGLAINVIRANHNCDKVKISARLSYNTIF